MADAKQSPWYVADWTDSTTHVTHWTVRNRITGDALNNDSGRIKRFRNPHSADGACHGLNAAIPPSSNDQSKGGV